MSESPAGSASDDVGLSSESRVSDLTDRDVAASDRDAAANERDSSARDRDAAAEHRALGQSSRGYARSDRLAAAADRLTAEQDRLFAALDREFSDYDRRESARERDLAIDPDADGWREAARRRDLAAALRDDAARRRDELATQRSRVAADQDREAELRDRHSDFVDAMAELRDRTAVERDRAASARDVAAAHRDLLALERERHARTLVAEGREAPLSLLVVEAETDRQLATVDRLQSAMDRLATVQDRAVALSRLPAAGLDPDTGVLTTGEGLLALSRELIADDDSHTSVAGAIVDFGAVLTRDAPGLVALVDELRRSLSNRDLVIRWSATSFLVVLVGADAWRTADLLSGFGLPRIEFVPRSTGESLEPYLARLVASTASGPNA
jgi:hypothetical protein